MITASRAGQPPALALAVATIAVLAVAAGGAGCRKHRAAPALPAQHGALAGRLVSAAGLPLGEAWVEVRPLGFAGVAPVDRASPASAASRVARASDDGSFRFSGLPPGRYLLLARAGGHADARVTATVPDGSSGQLSLRLARAETLRGRVGDGRGAPIPGARVLAFFAGDAAVNPPREATTDADGRFAIDRLGPGRYRLLGEAAGFESTVLGEVAVPGPAADLHLAGEARAITGSVFASGAPAGGARVALAQAAGVPAREALAREDGTFVFTGLGAGAYSLRATRGTLASAAATAVVLADPSGPKASRREPAALRLDLAPGAFVEGRVVDDGGAAVAGASVRIETAGSDPLPALVTADGAGRFRAGPLAPGEYRLIPRHDGYVPARPVSARLDPAAPAPAQRLELVRGVVVAGQVVDGAGAPVAAATVRCMASGIEDLVVLYDPLPPAAEAAAMPAGTGRALGATRTVRTDGAGRFEVSDLLPGRYRLEVSRAAAIPLRTDELALAPGERRDAGTLRLQEGVAVSGKVSDDEGAAVAGAHVAVRRRAAAAATGRGAPADVDVGLYAVTDGAGRFALSLAAGAYALGVTAPNLTDRTVAIDVGPAPAVPAEVDVRLSRADGTLEGIARDEGGRPLARARVTAWPPGDAPGAPAPDASPFASTVTDAGGHFTLSHVPRRALLVEVRHPDYPSAFEPATPGTLVEVKASIPGGIAGEVRDRGGGAPIARFQVEAAGPGGRTATATRGKQGAFSIARLLPGRWRLVASAPGFVTAEREVDVPSSAALGEPSVRDLRLELVSSK